jgi:hypothetical protein
MYGAAWVVSLRRMDRARSRTERRPRVLDRDLDLDLDVVGGLSLDPALDLDLDVDLDVVGGLSLDPALDLDLDVDLVCCVCGLSLDPERDRDRDRERDREREREGGMVLCRVRYCLPLDSRYPKETNYSVTVSEQESVSGVRGRFFVESADVVPCEAAKCTGKCRRRPRNRHLDMGHEIVSKGHTCSIASAWKARIHSPHAPHDTGRWGQRSRSSSSAI